MKTRNISSQHAPLSEPRSLAHSEGRWQQAMRNAITDVDTLFAELQLPTAYKEAARRATRLFDLRVPRGYVARMHHGDIHDPLLRQILPLDAEFHDPPDFVDDAVGDMASAEGDGLLHKYHGRALLVTTGACAIHCRYCFRRHFDYAAQHAGGSHTQAALARIAADSSIREVILSGGDPLSLSNTRLLSLGRQISEIAHVKRLRLHTRTPIVLPERVDAEILDWLANTPIQSVMVVHANHANELSHEVAQTLRSLRQAGVTLLNQAVLLAGVNDQAEAQIRLSEALFEAGVLPYYLHLLDRVRGTAHFEVSATRATRLMQDVSAHLPGFLVPRLAREGAGEAAKSVLAVPARQQDQGLFIDDGSVYR